MESKKLTIYVQNLNHEIKRDTEISLLKKESCVIFNNSLLSLDNGEYIMASRVWDGNVRKWDGVNYVLVTKFDSKMKKIGEKIVLGPKDTPIISPEEKEILKQKYTARKPANEDEAAIWVQRKFRRNLKSETHLETHQKGAEDPRLFYHNGEIYLLTNDLNIRLNKSGSSESIPRHMFLAKINPDRLNLVPFPNGKINVPICIDISSNFEKNWGPLTLDGQLYFVYNVDPLIIFRVVDIAEGKCEKIQETKSQLIDLIRNPFKDLNSHLRNSSPLVELEKNKFLGIGHFVVNLDKETNINKFVISDILKSKYSSKDKDYFYKHYKKYYLTYFYILEFDTETQKFDIVKVSPYFQLPNMESTVELINFACSFFIDSEDNIIISYGVGDNRTYLGKMHMDLVKASLFKLDSIVISETFNINPDFFIELVRGIRSYNGLSTNISSYINYNYLGLNPKIPTSVIYPISYSGTTIRQSMPEIITGKSSAMPEMRTGTSSAMPEIIPDSGISVEFDIVFTYVDGRDSEWQARYQTIFPGSTPEWQRYYPAGEIQNALRLIEKFAPDVNKIYIVTQQQTVELPTFFDANFANKIKIIDHTEIIPKKYLPTYNSVVIEAFLHNIPDLKEHFIYCNDDMMITDFLTDNHFKTGNKTNIYVQKYDKDPYKLSEEYTEFMRANNNFTGVENFSNSNLRNGTITYVLPAGKTKLPLLIREEWRFLDLNSNLTALDKQADKKLLDNLFRITHMPIFLTKTLCWETSVFFKDSLSPTFFNKKRSKQLLTGSVNFHVLCFWYANNYPLDYQILIVPTPIHKSKLFDGLPSIEQLRSGNYNFICVQDVGHEDKDKLSSVISNYLEQFDMK